jgi:hypothetical protein
LSIRRLLRQLWTREDHLRVGSGYGAVQACCQSGELLTDEDDGELSGERPDLLEELDERSLGLGHEPESTAQPGKRVRCRRLDSLAGRRGVGRAGP